MDHFAVVDQCVPSLKPQIVDRKDDRLENADLVVVERTVDEDPRRPPLHSEGAIFIRMLRSSPLKRSLELGRITSAFGNH